jgi:hypothetical protein
VAALGARGKHSEFCIKEQIKSLCGERIAYGKDISSEN